MKKYTFDDIEKSGLLLYRYIRGSHAYGTQLPNGQSDIDEGGVFLEPTDQIIGLGLDFQDEIQDEKHDKVWYSLKKYLNLLCTSNPNMLESLFVDDEFVIYEHPIITGIKKHRKEFVTKECFNAFSGYAYTQISRCRGQNKMVVNPIEKRLWPLDFCYVPYRQGSSNIREWLSHRGLEQRFCGLVSINNMPGCYGVYYDWGAHNSEKYKDYGEFESDGPYYRFVESTFDDPYIGDIETFVMGEWFDKHQKPIGYRGIVREDGNSDDVRCSSVERDIRPVTTMCYNQNGFETHCRKWKQYQDWVKKRNPARYESNLGHNYDRKNVCHAFRLMNMGIEIARTGEVHVNRKGIDANFLLGVRTGNYEYEYIIDLLEQRNAEMKEAIANSTLPETVNREFVNNLLVDIRRKTIHFND